MDSNRYRKRIADEILRKTLESSGAVLIEGPKWCGKTWTALQMAKSFIMIQDPDKTAGYLLQAGVKPSLLLEGETPRLIDEWQMAPVLWDAVRFAVDQRGKPGQFILTGSTAPSFNSTMHTGTGRIARMKMRPMSLYESGESNGEVSLSALFEGAVPEGKSNITIEEMSFLIARGGWPGSLNLKKESALLQSRHYLDAIINSDLYEVSDSRRDTLKLLSLIESLARNVATMASIETLRRDVSGSQNPIAANTVQAYLEILENLFVFEDQPAWNAKLRSRARLRKSPKRHFVDPSIAVAALRTGPEGLLKDFNTLGILFESLCIRDLRIYAQSIGGEICHYRDDTNLEVDAIIDLNDGRWGAVEIKMSPTQVNEASRNLLMLRDKIDDKSMRPPAFLMVLTGSGYAMRLDNGVLVVPIGSLKN